MPIYTISFNSTEIHFRIKVIAGIISKHEKIKTCFKGFKHLNIFKIINQIKSYLETIHTSLGECKPTGASLFVRKSIQNHTKNATGCLNFGKTPPDSTANNPKLFQFIACTSMKKLPSSVQLSQFCLISLGKKSLKNPIIAKTLYQTCSVNFPKC